MNFFHNSDFDRPERKSHGAKWPGNERARERVGQGANRPESYWPIRSGERIGPGAKRLGTDFAANEAIHRASPVYSRASPVYSQMGYIGTGLALCQLYRI